MAAKQEQREPSPYKRALEEIAEDVRGQCALEKHQRETGVPTILIDRIRAKSYKRIAVTVERTLGLDLGVDPYQF